MTRARVPYLVPVAADGSLPAAPAPVFASLAGRAQLTPTQRHDVEAARLLVMQTGELLDHHPHAYVAGLLEGAASNLLDLLDTITRPED